MIKKYIRQAMSVASGVVVGSIIAYSYSFYSGNKVPIFIPYDSVNVVEVTNLDDSVIVSATFKKLECVINRLDAFYIANNQYIFTTWVDLQGIPTNLDRTKGLQVLLLEVKKDKKATAIELRTRHACEYVTKNGSVKSVFVDKIFATIPLEGKT